MKQLNWMGKNGFTWFMGVVQDVNDPLRIGRVKVRCYGWHSADLNELPVETLPWAQVMIPATSASASSIGTSPTGLLNGSFVIGFFIDGETAQQPIVMGSLHGVPSSPIDGFKDPNGIYPLNPNTPDTPNLAYERAPIDHVFVSRFDTRETNIPMAKKVKASSVAADKNEEEYELKTWDEPKYRSDLESKYPKNHVIQTESGHAFETDDTSGNERIHQYHKTGTFEEINYKGERITKIVSNDYEIVVKDKNVWVNGDCNITIAGNARLRIDGDRIEEVMGDYNLTVYGDTITKIVGNESKEILGFRSEQINQDEKKRVSKNKITIVGDDATQTIGKNNTITIGNDSIEIVSKNKFVTAVGNTAIASAGTMDIGSGSNFSLAAGGNYTTKINGVTTETYASAYNITYSSNYNVYYGADTLTRKLAGGTDKACPGDTRSSASDCSTVPTV